MNVEEAIKHCKEIIKQNTTIVKDAYKSGDINTMQLVANCDKDNIAIETILNELEKKDKQLQDISDEFLKYNWKESNNEQIYNQLKSLYNAIFKKKASEEE